jgi:hypothetical protein
VGVKASAAGKSAIGKAIDDRDLRYQNYAKMSMEIGISYKTIGKFVNGDSVRKSTASAIINYLGLNRAEIVPDAEWDKGTADESTSIDELWDDLCQLAKYAPTRLGLVLAQEVTAGFGDRGRAKFLTEIVAESKVWIDLDVQQPGYLILLNLDAAGDITCLSPSHCVPEYRLEVGVERLPQEVSKKERVFEPATLGKEVLLAAILPEQPDFAWLSVDDFQTLDAVQLGQLLACVKASKKPVDLIRSSVTIVPR